MSITIVVDWTTQPFNQLMKGKKIAVTFNISKQPNRKDAMIENDIDLLITYSLFFLLVNFIANCDVAHNTEK